MQPRTRTVWLRDLAVARFVTTAPFITRGVKTCRKVHSLHVLSFLRQQHYNLSLLSLVVCVCVCVCARARARAQVFAHTRMCVCVCVDVRLSVTARAPWTDFGCDVSFHAASCTFCVIICA